MNSDFLTIAEQSGFTQTGRLDEVERLSDAFSAAWPGALRSFEFGRSAGGRPLRALMAFAQRRLDAAGAGPRGISRSDDSSRNTSG